MTDNEKDEWTAVIALVFAIIFVIGGLFGAGALAIIQVLL